MASLVLGFPSRPAFRLLDHLLKHTAQRIYLVCNPEAGAELRGQGLERHHDRIRVMEGDITSVDLGLSQEEYGELLRNVVHLHHTVGLTAPDGAERAEEGHKRVVSAMRETLSLARSSTCLERLVVYSSISVSGDYSELFNEGDLNVGQKFVSPHDEGLAVSEKMARAVAAKVPLVILRAGDLIDLTELGQGTPLEPVLALLAGPLDQLGPYFVPTSLKGDEPLHLTPMECLVKAGTFLAEAPPATGATVHLVERLPPTLMEALSRVSRLAQKPAPVFGSAPSNWLAQARGGLPWGDRGWPPKLRGGVRYSIVNQERLLGPAGLACPAFDSYVQGLVETLSKRNQSLEGMRSS